MVQSSTCLNSISKFPILFWLHNFHGSQTFWVKPHHFNILSPHFQNQGAQAPQGQPGHGGRCDGLHDVVELVSNHMAFAAIVGASASSCRVVTWGNAECGGVTSESLRDPWAGWVYSILLRLNYYILLPFSPSLRRFGAYLFVEERDSTIHTTKSYGLWSIPHDDISWEAWQSREAQDRLKDVDKVEASSRAFAAILRDETVVAWGDAEWGGHLLPLGILW